MIDEFVAAQMAVLGLEDDAFAEYVLQLAREDTMNRDEKTDAITAFLADATDAPVDDFVKELLGRCDAAREEAARLAAETRAGLAAKSEEKEHKRLASDAPAQQATGKGKELSKEERRRREELLKRYAYDLDEIVQVDGEDVIVYKEKGPNDALVVIEPNRNAEIAAGKARAAKEKAAEESRKQKERENELRLEQQTQKEKQKRRTQKKEKRRM